MLLGFELIYFGYIASAVFNKNRFKGEDYFF